MKLNIMKEASLQSVLEKTQQIAAYTEIIAEGSEIDSWAAIQTFIRNGIGMKKFPTGTQFTTTHSTWGDITWDVVCHDIFVDALPDVGIPGCRYITQNGIFFWRNGEFVLVAGTSPIARPRDDVNYSMTLLAHYRDKDGVQFDSAEAMYYAANLLPSGAYTFKNGTTDYYFTLVNDVPVGGQIVIDSTPSTFTVYDSVGSTTSIETGSVSTTSISGATDLGKLGSGSLNHWDRIKYGSNNYKESAIRQFLNSSAAAGSVWTPQTHFDRPPSWASTKAGFMAGLPADFLAVVGEVDVKCKTNSTYEAPDSTTPVNSTYTVRDKFYLASRKEVTNEDYTPYDGSVLFPYYDGAKNVDRIKYRMDSHTTAGHWWTRTPNSGSVFRVYCVQQNGALDYVYPGINYSCVPACTIY